MSHYSCIVRPFLWIRDEAHSKDVSSKLATSLSPNWTSAQDGCPVGKRSPTNVVDNTTFCRTGPPADVPTDSPFRSIRCLDFLAAISIHPGMIHSVRTLSDSFVSRTTMNPQCKGGGYLLETLALRDWYTLVRWQNRAGALVLPISCLLWHADATQLRLYCYNDTGGCERPILLPPRFAA